MFQGAGSDGFVHGSMIPTCEDQSSAAVIFSAPPRRRQRSSRCTTCLHLPASPAPQRLLEPARPRLLSLELLSGAPSVQCGRSTAKRSTCASWRNAPTVSRSRPERPDSPSSPPPPPKPAALLLPLRVQYPENKILKALEWQKARTPLLAIPERNRAAGYPPEVVDYSHWNAHSIFFLDPAGNVVEYIARHDLKNGDSAPFGWSDILYASEIGIVVDDVAATAAKLAEVAAVALTRAGATSSRLSATSSGLLLIMKRGRVIDFSSQAENGVRVFRTAVTVRGPKATKYQLPGYPYPRRSRGTVQLRLTSTLGSRAEGARWKQ